MALKLCQEAERFAEGLETARTSLTVRRGALGLRASLDRVGPAGAGDRPTRSRRSLKAISKQRTGGRVDTDAVLKARVPPRPPLSASAGQSND